MRCITWPGINLLSSRIALYDGKYLSSPKKGEYSSTLKSKKLQEISTHQYGQTGEFTPGVYLLVSKLPGQTKGSAGA